MGAAGVSVLPEGSLLSVWASIVKDGHNGTDIKAWRRNIAPQVKEDHTIYASDTVMPAVLPPVH